MTHDEAPLRQQRSDLLRILDAAANRCLEGLRVAEDVVRFRWNDEHLTRRLKNCRHAVANGLLQTGFSWPDRVTCRDTLGDVGTEIRTAAESTRDSLDSIVTANLHRAQEALRTLAEVAKSIAPAAANVFEQARYELYTLEKSITVTLDSLRQLAKAQLYVLVGGAGSNDELANHVRQLVDHGVDLIQVRDQALCDQELLQRAQLVRELTSDSATRCIVNDRPDIAMAVRADGVHLGQDDLPVQVARKIVGPRALIGVSTHNLEQARQAVLAGANYLGIGPTFPSSTKTFFDFPGLPLLASVAAEIRLPAFAIGGIDATNIQRVVEQGVFRVAIQGALSDKSDVPDTIRRLRAALPAVPAAG